MRIITWNVNSIRTRLERVLGLLQRHEPDVLCLQETKVPDDAFPDDALAEIGYQAASFGQKGGYNGVALISKQPLGDVERSFDANPLPDEARAISGTTADGVRVINLYVVNGQSVDSEKYQAKLDWLDTLLRWLVKFHQPEQPLVMVGDFNIAPDERDIHNPELWDGKVLCSEAERARLRAIRDWGLPTYCALSRATAVSSAGGTIASGRLPATSVCG
jgi:exodeoxyribonuclease-3